MQVLYQDSLEPEMMKGHEPLEVVHVLYSPEQVYIQHQINFLKILNLKKLQEKRTEGIQWPDSVIVVPHECFEERDQHGYPPYSGIILEPGKILLEPKGAAGANGSTSAQYES